MSGSVVEWPSAATPRSAQGWPALLAGLRAASLEWAHVSPARRGRIVGRAARGLLRDVPGVLRDLPARPALQSITAELLPLLAAATYLRRKTGRVLATRRLSPIGAPIWLWGTRARVERRPHGAVLILAPGNYPLMLGGIQTLQALAAGNAVALKPAPGTTAALARLARALHRAGLPEGLLVLLPEEAGPEASSAGFDLISLTGSAETGRRVAQAAARTLTPTIMELSGADPVFVLQGADLERVARALVFGLRLNGSRTCIAPRRVFIGRDAAAGLLARVEALLAPMAGDDEIAPPLDALRREVLAAGGRARFVSGALLINGDGRLAGLLGRDLFLPWLGLISVSNMEEALELEAACDYALGASVFGPEDAARALAGRLRAGSICLNDLIAPTADPRLPFGGAGRSGYGVTRGAEGLLAMTRPVAISARSGPALHLWTPPARGSDARP